MAKDVRGQARGAAVLAADFGRAHLPCDRLTPLAAYDVPGQRVTEDTDIKRTTIWALAERPEEFARPGVPRTVMPSPPATPALTATPSVTYDLVRNHDDVTSWCS